MSQIKYLNESQVKQLRIELESAIQTIAQKHGLKASGLGNISFNPNSMTTQKITLAVESTQPNIADIPLADLIGNKYKLGSRVFLISSVKDDNVIGVTNRGARYLLSKEELSTMIKL